MKRAGFYLIYGLLWIITLLPLPVLYWFSDLLYLFIYHIFRYRRGVVAENLRYAFPEKSDHERLKIGKAFYHYFCDFIFEAFKPLHFSKSNLSKRFVYLNPEVLNRYHEKKQSVVLISGHYGNWEWLINIENYIQHKFLAIYKPLSDKNFDRLIKNIREKYRKNGKMVAMDDIYREILKNEREGQLIITWFLGDQAPPKDYPLWIEFMNRETPFYAGPEKIARKFGHAVVFMNIQKVKRGHYEVEFIPLFDDPKKTHENEITQKHVKVLENIIRKEPAYWLWSHRRWKHQRQKMGSN
jgi:KDO2-lipid IV(A) lauroyltransferase